MARTVLKLKAPSKALEKARTSIERAKEVWASNTIEGFMSGWAVWYGNFVVPALARIRLPPKTNDIKTNVVNRVTPVATAISRASGMYRQQKIAEIGIGPAPVAPVSRPPSAY